MLSGILLFFVFQPQEQIPGEKDQRSPFSLKQVASAMQIGFATANIEEYLQWYSNAASSKYINDSVNGFPDIFYAVETNNNKLLRVWIRCGGDVNAVCYRKSGAANVPLKAFAVINSDNIREENTVMICSLLSL
jgi:hypothetical protein